MKSIKLDINSEIEFSFKESLLDCFKPLRDVNEFTEFVSDGVITSVYNILSDAEYIDNVYEIEDIFLKEMFFKYQSAYYNLV